MMSMSNHEEGNSGISGVRASDAEAVARNYESRREAKRLAYDEMISMFRRHKEERRRSEAKISAANLSLEEARLELLSRLKKTGRRIVVVDGIGFRLQADGKGFQRIELDTPERDNP